MQEKHGYIISTAWLQLAVFQTIHLLCYRFCAVMLMGTLVYGIRYTFPEYVCTLLVAGGVSVFALSKVCCIHNKWHFIVSLPFFLSPIPLWFVLKASVSSFCWSILICWFQTSSKTISKLAHPNAPLGYTLCFFNLAFDGFTNATQDSLTTRYGITIVAYT